MKVIKPAESFSQLKTIIIIIKLELYLRDRIERERGGGERGRAQEMKGRIALGRVQALNQGGRCQVKPQEGKEAEEAAQEEGRIKMKQARAGVGGG